MKINRAKTYQHYKGNVEIGSKIVKCENTVFDSFFYVLHCGSKTHTSQLVPSNHRLTPTIYHTGRHYTIPWATRSVHKNCLLTVSKFALVRSTTFAWHTQSPARTKKKANVRNIFTKTDNKAVSSLSTTVQERLTNDCEHSNSVFTYKYPVEGMVTSSWNCTWWRALLWCLPPLGNSHFNSNSF